MLKNVLSASALLLSAALASAATAPGIFIIPQGQVDIRSGTGDWTPISGRTPLSPGQEVRTKDSSAALITFSDGSKLALSPNAEFSVEKSDRQETSLKLGLGKLRAFFAGYMSSRLNVRTPTAVAAVRGTEFEMSADPKGQSEVNVKEGHLEVSDAQGHQAVVTAEETIKVGSQGMDKPELVSLKDERAQPAARPMAVQFERAHDQARTMIEDLRNRELKANEAQLGKDVIDAFGRRVRLEEYLLRPANNQFKLLFLSLRDDRFDWGHILETFKNSIPNDPTQWEGIFSGSFFSRTQPANWITNFEFFATNTVDSIKETIAFGDPILINFNGFNTPGTTIGSLYYPSSMDYKQILSGPGITLGAVNNTRTQFEQVEVYTPSNGLFTWQQSIVNNVGALTLLNQFQMNPADAVDVANGGCTPGRGESCVDYSPAGHNAFAVGTANYQPQAQFNGYNPDIPDRFPNGPTKADVLSQTAYPDGSIVTSEKILVSDKGHIWDSASPNFGQDGNYNLEIVVGSNLFKGPSGNIDVLIAPEILADKQNGTSDAKQIIP